ncbi:MAG TPA: ThuA domain-containing protein [Candidatus Stackebrandtia excrementipullorum]|nr:ThuA domain-containing protein [Candidatus Stackebrandtia excrementipullorum]
MLIRAWLMVVVTTVALISPMSAVPAMGADPHLSVLVFTDTESVHLVTEDAVDFIEMNGRRHGFDVVTTDRADVFTSQTLGSYEVIVWLNNEGGVLNDAERAGFSDWYRNGGGFVGIHAAAYAEPDWEFFEDLVGARPLTGERDKPSKRTITVNTGHPAVADMPDEWNDQEEQWYRFDRDPGDNAGTTVLATVSSQHGDTTQPVAWCREFEGGRSWYTALGHRSKTYEDGDYMRMLRGGMTWVAGLTEQPPVDDRDAAAVWPYSLSFLAWVAAIAVGGGLAVRGLNRRESASSSV